MFITIHIILSICINISYTCLHITYNIRNATTGVKSYFNAATKFTSKKYVGAQCKVRRQLICEPLSFDWFSRENYKDDMVYLMKACVVETFEKKATLVSLCCGMVRVFTYLHTDSVIVLQFKKVYLRLYLSIYRYFYCIVYFI